MFRHLPKVRIFKKWITPHGWFLKRSLISVRNVSRPKVLVIYTYLNLTVLFPFFRSKRNHPCRMQRKVFPSHSTCFWMVSTSTGSLLPWPHKQCAVIQKERFNQFLPDQFSSCLVQFRGAAVSPLHPFLNNFDLEHCDTLQYFVYRCTHSDQCSRFRTFHSFPCMSAHAFLKNLVYAPVNRNKSSGRRWRLQNEGNKVCDQTPGHGILAETEALLNDVPVKKDVERKT